MNLIEQEKQVCEKVSLALDRNTVAKALNLVDGLIDRTVQNYSKILLIISNAITTVENRIQTT